jgi:hypothetical protein
VVVSKTAVSVLVAPGRTSVLSSVDVRRIVCVIVFAVFRLLALIVSIEVEVRETVVTIVVNLVEAVT